KDDNALTVYWNGGHKELARTSKLALARQPVELIAERYRLSKTDRKATTAAAVRAQYHDNCRTTSSESAAARAAASTIPHNLDFDHGPSSTSPLASPHSRSTSRPRLSVTAICHLRLRGCRSARVHRRSDRAAARRYLSRALGYRHLSRGSRLRCDGAAAFRARAQAWHRARQLGRAHRFRLPRADIRVGLESRARAVRDRAGRADCAIGRGARGASRIRRRRSVYCV